MIEVFVASRDLVARQRSSLSIRFANNGRGPCSNVVFKLRLPPGIVLLGGTDLVEIPRIAAGATYTHEVLVMAQRRGQFELTTKNFSYRDEFDMPVRVNDFRAGLTATAAAPPIVRPIGNLTVACQNGELALGEWDELRILVTNSTGVTIDDVVVAVHGPFQSNANQSRIELMRQGEAARFSFRVNADQGGRHVPITVRSTYRHLDQSQVQQDILDVVVRKAVPDKETVPTAQTVLYLAASPRDLPPLRLDKEISKIKEKLQLSKNRHRYRIESVTAAQFEDISQSLIDHEPHVIHFSGHGDADGNLCVEDAVGNATLLTPEGLAELFAQHKSTVRCVILNACYSAHLAQALASRIDHVVGMRFRIEDEAATQFSVGFYTGLFGGMSVPDAFARGRSHIQSQLTMQPEYLTPLLFPS